MRRDQSADLEIRLRMNPRYDTKETTADSRS